MLCIDAVHTYDANQYDIEWESIRSDYGRACGKCFPTVLVGILGALLRRRYPLGSRRRGGGELVCMEGSGEVRES